MFYKNYKNQLFSTIILSILIIFTSCDKSKKFDPDRPINAEGKRKKNIEEGRGASIGSILGGVGGTNYEFSSSNPMWRASLETLDFLPLTTVDYSGGMIITDWYSENNNLEAIKISIRFLSNEIRSDSVKIIIHKKTCTNNFNCTTGLLKTTTISDELRSTILKKAALYQKTDKKKK